MQSSAVPEEKQPVDLPCAESWLKTKIWPTFACDTESEPLYIVDLFCGCGGLTLGAFEACRQLNRLPVIKMAIDSDVDSLDVFQKNFQTESRVTQAIDIQKICRRTLSAPLTEPELVLKESLGKVHLLLAGPPCQGHSDLNNRTRRNDKRNRLYLHAIRFVQILEPDMVIIENVPTVRHDSSGVLQEALSILKSMKYSVHDPIVDISNLGLPQLRKRHVLIASKKQCSVFAPDGSRAKLPISSVLEDLLNIPTMAAKDIFNRAPQLSAENQRRIAYLFRHDLNDLPNKMRPPCHKFKTHSYVSMYGRLDWSLPAQTITSGFGSPGQGRYIHPKQQRLITAHEAARLQGFPDFFKFDSVGKKVKLRKMIANAVPPVLSASILLHLMQGRKIT